MTEFSPPAKPFADKVQTKLYISREASKRLDEVQARTKLSRSAIIDTLITDHCRIAGEAQPQRPRRSFDL